MPGTYAEMSPVQQGRPAGPGGAPQPPGHAASPVP
jgi:hypothetical protein